MFLGQPLSLRTSVTHLGHILTHNLNDDEDIASAIKDMCCKANCMLHTFACCDPIVKTHLFSIFCLSLYGAALWKYSNPQLKSLEVAFNNILRKIWSLPRHCHTAILHCVARRPSMINTVLSRLSRLLLSASRSPSRLISDVYTESALSAFTLATTLCLVPDTARATVSRMFSVVLLYVMLAAHVNLTII